MLRLRLRVLNLNLSLKLPAFLLNVNEVEQDPVVDKDKYDSY
jgi:hypothetical protein